MQLLIFCLSYVAALKLFVIFLTVLLYTTSCENLEFICVNVLASNVKKLQLM